MRGKAWAWVMLDVAGPQQFVDQASAFAPTGVHAHADRRPPHLHVRGGLPEDLAAHMLQHRKGLLAHLPSILRYQGLLRTPPAAGRGLFASLNLYPPPLHVVPSRPSRCLLEAILGALRQDSMQDPANELRRIPLPRTPLHKSYYSVSWPLEALSGRNHKDT